MLKILNLSFVSQARLFLYRCNLLLCQFHSFLGLVANLCLTMTLPRKTCTTSASGMGLLISECWYAPDSLAFLLMAGRLLMVRFVDRGWCGASQKTICRSRCKFKNGLVQIRFSYRHMFLSLSCACCSTGDF